MHEYGKRVDDTLLGKISKLWPIAIGLFGVMYAAITNYNMIKNNTDSILKLYSVTDNLNARLAIMEKEAAVKNSQFAVLLSRNDRIEDKLDKLIIKRDR